MTIISDDQNVKMQLLTSLISDRETSGADLNFDIASMPLRDNPTKEIVTISFDKGHMLEYKKLCLAGTSEDMKLLKTNLGKRED